MLLLWQRRAFSRACSAIWPRQLLWPRCIHSCLEQLPKACMQLAADTAGCGFSYMQQVASCGLHAVDDSLVWLCAAPPVQPLSPLVCMKSNDWIISYYSLLCITSRAAAWTTVYRGFSAKGCVSKTACSSKCSSRRSIHHNPMPTHGKPT